MDFQQPVPGGEFQQRRPPLGSLSGGNLQVWGQGSGGTLSVGTLGLSTTFAGYYGATSNTVGLNLVGGGLTLTGANPFTPVAITAGTLAIGAGGNTGSLANTSTSGTIIDNGVLAFNRSDSISYANAISGSGGLLQLGTGTLALSGTNTYSGNTAVNGGLLSLAATGALGGTGNISFGGGTLQYSASNSLDYSARIANSGGPISIDTNGLTISFNNSLAASNTGGLIKVDSGTLSLSASNGYSGGTTLSAGLLALGSTATLGAAGPLAVNGGTLDLGTTTQGVAAVSVSAGTIQNGADGRLVCRQQPGPSAD